MKLRLLVKSERSGIYILKPGQGRQVVVKSEEKDTLQKSVGPELLCWKMSVNTMEEANTERTLVTSKNSVPVKNFRRKHLQIERFINMSVLNIHTTISYRLDEDAQGCSVLYTDG